MVPAGRVIQADLVQCVHCANSRNQNDAIVLQPMKQLVAFGEGLKEPWHLFSRDFRALRDLFSLKVTCLQ